ncbi:multicopper oxidase-domain-containing protein [Clohesyomyces aquaticus]|uniref:Multicopper oxidase-domain-containing protein n=1 Tax=Clohesyomyces aquaticus TaxID=1231657 RepID=A0A1Y1ZI23_9PLEO|nr:multicopper oxidase-domain-containing protein [Clohesyomyces aquaticus]
MVSFWSRIVTLFNCLTLSPNRADWANQLPLLSSPAAVTLKPLSETTQSSPPNPFIPPTAPDNFKCEYPKLNDYTFCSTYGDRSCWLRSNTSQYDINTNYEKEFPEGIVRKYYLEVGTKTIAPDGVTREAMLVNGSYPGPWIQACWGDWLEITVKNNLPANGTTIHWHGIRQLNTTASDGVNAVTQCPIAPGETYTYRFRAMQYGTTWYHSHYSLQYGEGVLGPMTIHGPSSADFDEAKSPILMTDWSHKSWFSMWWDGLTKANATTTIDNILLSGKGTFPATKPSKEFRYNFVTGKRYLLRLINTSVDTIFVFSIDNHKIQVIGVDLVPIVPYMTDHIVIGIGQRYHVIVTANPIDGNDDATYWIRTSPAKGCTPPGLFPNEVDSRTGIVVYRKSTAEPVDYPIKYPLTCRDEPYDKLVPIVRWDIGPPSNVAADSQFDVTLGSIIAGKKWPASVEKARWSMYSDTMWLDFSNVTLAQNLTAPQQAYDSHSVVVKQDSKEDQWVYLLISGTGVPRAGRNFVPAAHPIHLHGHDFAILQQSTQKYQIGGLNLNLKNPPRRDVALMPTNGFLVLAFKADNPGVWLMHCHIATHASGGLAMQIIENGGRVMLDAFDQKQLSETCKKWDTWVADPKNHFLQDDSGI